MLKRKHNPERARQKAKTVFLLSGQVTCGLCGTPYMGNSAINNGTRCDYYECGSRDRTRTCTNRRIRKNVLEELVLEEIEKRIFAPKVRSKLVDKLLDFNINNIVTKVAMGNEHRLFSYGYISRHSGRPYNLAFDRLFMSIGGSAFQRGANIMPLSGTSLYGDGC